MFTTHSTCCAGLVVLLIGCSAFHVWLHCTRCILHDGRALSLELKRTRQLIARLEFSLDSIQRTLRRERRTSASVHAACDVAFTKSRSPRQAKEPWEREVRNLRRRVRRLEDR